VYPTRKGAERQAAAAYASGYKEPEEEAMNRCPNCGFQSDSDTGQTYDPTAPCPSCGAGGKRAKEGYGRLRGDEPGLRSPDFKSGDTIPKDYTADGKNESPPLRWGLPDGTVEIAIVVDDPDAPTETPWVHWVAYGIPGEKTGIKRGEKPPKEGKNSWGSTEYRGPEPPPGSPHRYWFKVYALDKQLDLAPGASKQDLIKAMQGHVLDRDALVAFYRREKKEESAMSIPKMIQESLPMCRELLDKRGGFRSLQEGSVLDLNPDKLTDAERKVYDGLSDAARRLFNDLAWSKAKKTKYRGSLASTAAKVELDKKKLAKVDWAKDANPVNDVVWLVKKGEAMAKRLTS
jgi:Raf kinase inhibitor-like YbhB/YbcL family protein